jgi:hypothetical protein
MRVIAELQGTDYGISRVVVTLRRDDIIGVTTPVAQ